MKNFFTLLLLSAAMLNPKTGQAQCGTPVNLQASWNNNVSTFTWDAVPGATDYTFQLGWAGAQWGEYDVICPANQHDLAGLMQGGAFQFRVIANCNGTLSSPSATFFYNTPCVQPYGLNTTSITTNSAVLNWQQSSGNNNINTGFSVSYRPAVTNAAWIQLTNNYNHPTATFFNLTGLQPGTAYEWRVRRVCAFSNSNYINSQFVTLSCIPNGNNGVEWIRLFNLGGINRLSGAETGGYVNTGLGTDLVIGSSSNAGQIGAGFFGNSRTEKFALYIDFNRNGSFADPGESLLSSTINGNNIRNFNISIPATATPGATRMRVVMRRNNGNVSSCITGYQGEAEDYNVNLVSANKMFVSNNTINISNEENNVVVTRVKVSPNPSFGEFNIEVPPTFTATRYEIFNTAGNIIVKESLKEKSMFKVSLMNVPKGIYLLRVFDKQGAMQTTKLVVQ